MRIQDVFRPVAIGALMLALSACGAPSMAQTPAIVAAQPMAQPTVIAQPTLVLNNAPDAVVESVASSASLPVVEQATMFYFWPTIMPSGLVISRHTTETTDGGFVMELHDPANPQNYVWIVSEPSMAGGMQRGDPIIVRGQPGRAFSTGAGANVTWLEGEQWIRVSGSSLSTEQAIGLAESLQPLDRATWLDLVQANG